MHRGAFFAVIAFQGALVLFTFAASPFLDLSPVANAQGQNSDIDYEIGVVVYPGDGEVKLTWKPSGNQDWDDAQEFGYQRKLVGPGQSSDWSPGELNNKPKILIPSYNTDSDTGYRSYSVTNLTNGQLYSFVIRKKTGADSPDPEYGPPSYPDQTTPGQIAAGLQEGADAEVTDLRDLLSKVEKLLPNMSETHRRAFLALYVLFNKLAIPEMRMASLEHMLSSHQSEMERPSVEAMLLHLLLGTDPAWSLEEHQAIHDAYLRDQGRRDCLRMPPAFKAGLSLALAERYRLSGNAEHTAVHPRKIKTVSLPGPNASL